VDKGNSYTKLGGRIEFGGPAHWVTHRWQRWEIILNL